MARQGNGNYALPAGNPVVVGTTITASWANTTLADIAQELTNSLSRDGQAPMNGSLKIIDGTSTGPGISFNGESSTGLFRPSAGVLSFSVLGSERVRVDSTGNVGIGSTSPSTALHISTTTADKITLQHPGFGSAVLGSDSAGSVIFKADEANTQASTVYVWRSDAVERMRIDSSGNLGLGTASPGFRLDVDHAGGVARFRNGATAYGSIALGASATAALNYQISSDGSGNLIVFKGIPGSGVEQIRVDTNGNLGVGGTPTNYTGSGYDSIAINGTTGGILEFQGNGTQAARITGWSNTLSIHTNNVERIRVDSNGNLSLGASSTTARLLVQGSGAQETAVVQHGGTNHSIININQSDALGTNPSFRPILSFRKGGTTSFNLSVDGSSQGLTFYEAYSATAAHAFVTNSVERLRIDGTGKVGIGTASPAVTLHIVGTDSIRLPSGTTAQRPASAAIGDTRYNTTLNQFEGFSASGWGAIGGGATGSPGNYAFYENDVSIIGDYTIGTGKNAMSAGPVSVNNGVVITVPDGSAWTVV